MDVNKQHEHSTFMTLDDMYSVNENKLKRAIGNRMMVHGHTPYTCVYCTGNFISCDTGSSVMPNGKLSLINLSEQSYFCNDTHSDEVLLLPIRELDIKERIGKTGPGTPKDKHEKGCPVKSNHST